MTTLDAELRVVADIGTVLDTPVVLERESGAWCFRVNRGAERVPSCQAAQLSSASMRVATDGGRFGGGAVVLESLHELGSRRVVESEKRTSNARSRVTRSRRLSRITRERSRYRSRPE